jgi:hypothetical protein
MKYNMMVYGVASVCAEVQVEADSDEEAIELAYEQADDWEIDCIDNMTSADIMSIEESDEEDEEID